MRPTAIAVGGSHACVLAGSGDVWCWGDNEEGQLGDGTTRSRTDLVKVQGLPAPAVQLDAGYTHSCARVEDGTVHCWRNAVASHEYGARDEPVAVMGLAPHVIAEAPVSAPWAVLLDVLRCVETGAGAGRRTLRAHGVSGAPGRCGLRARASGLSSIRSERDLMSRTMTAASRPTV